MAGPGVADRGEDVQRWRIAANTLNKEPGTVDKKWSSSTWFGLGAKNASNSQELTTSLSLSWIVWVNDLSYRIWIRFGTWNKGSLHRIVSLVTVSRELCRYRLNYLVNRRSDEK